MKLSDRRENEITILELKGNIMGDQDGTLFYDKLQDLIKQNRKKVLLDLSKVDWINSRGLGILISGLTTMRHHDGELKLAAVAEKVKSLLTLTRLITAFESYDTVEEAIGSFE
jgi:anti-sigma B factor antagonist